MQENGIRSYRGLRNKRNWQLCPYLDFHLKCAAVTWNLYHWDANKWLKRNPKDAEDLAEMKKRITRERVIFDYLDCNWSVSHFDLDRIPNMGMEYIRKLCTGVHQLNLSEDYIEYTRETRYI